MADMTVLERKLHGYQVVLWLKQTFEVVVASDEGAWDADADGRPEPRSTEEDGAELDTCEDPTLLALSSSTDGCVRKSSVYKAYVEMCAREGRPTMFTRAVVGKMAKRAFPDVQTKRRGPRGRVTQHYVGLRLINARGPSESSPTPNTSPDADSEPTPLRQCADTTQHESDSANAYAYTHRQDEPEWHSTAFAEGAASLGRGARFERRHASVGALPLGVSVPPPPRPRPLASSSWPAPSFLSVWAPYLPSTMAALDVHHYQQLAACGQGANHAPLHQQPPQEQGQEGEEMPLENLESVWDWRHDSVDVWQPPLFDITPSSSSASLAPTASRTIMTAELWAATSPQLPW